MKHTRFRFFRTTLPLFLFSLFILLSGCYKKQVAQDKIILPTNQVAGYVLFYFANDFTSKTAPTGRFDQNEFYYIDPIHLSGLEPQGILHKIQEDGTDRILCKKEGCLHNNKDCAAYILSKYELFSIQGVLYGLKNETAFSIYHFDFDNLNQPTLVSKTLAEPTDFMGANMAYADGCVYTTVMSRKSKILKTDLSSGITNVFYTLPADEISPSIQAIFDGIMIVSSNNINKAPVPTEFFAISLETGESQLITSLPAMLGVGEKSGCVYGKSVYYIDVKQNALLNYSLQDGQETVIAKDILPIQPSHMNPRIKISHIENGVLFFQYLYTPVNNSETHKYENLKVELTSGKADSMDLLTTSGTTEPVPAKILGKVGPYYIGKNGDEYILIQTEDYFSNIYDFKKTIKVNW